MILLKWLLPEVALATDHSRTGDYHDAKNQRCGVWSCVVDDAYMYSECEKLLDAFLDAMYELSWGACASPDVVFRDTTQTNCANVIRR
jgi:hypothetical protein